MGKYYMDNCYENTNMRNIKRCKCIHVDITH